MGPDLIRESGQSPAGEDRPSPELRRPDRTRAILDATYELLAEVGYERLTIDAVAARAHASKATIYRRWETKQELVTSAFQERGNARRLVAADDADADAGDLRGDLIVLLRVLREVASPGDALAFVSLLAASLQEPQIADVMRSELEVPWRHELAAILQRAVERGEVDPHDGAMNADAVFDVIMGLVMVRTVLRAEPMDESFLTQIVDSVLLPVLRG